MVLGCQAEAVVNSLKHDPAMSRERHFLCGEGESVCVWCVHLHTCISMCTHELVCCHVVGVGSAAEL